MAKTNKTNKTKWISIALIVLFFASILSLFGLSRVATAQNSELSTSDLAATGLPSVSNCALTQTTAYTALTQAQPDVYDIYVRLGLKGQAADVSVYFQGFSSTTCLKIGEGQVNANGWTRLGNLTLDQANAFGTYTLASSTLQSLPTANRPTVMLVSQTRPVCQPTDECRIVLDGKPAVLRASGGLLGSAALNTVVIKDPTQDTISQVDYYVDNKPAYSSKALESFDMRYVSSGEHQLHTVVTYNSKQQAVISESVDRGYVDDINNWIFSYFTSKKDIWTAVGITSGILILLGLILHFTRKLYTRHLWKKTHYAEQLNPANEHIPHPLESVSRFYAALLRSHQWLISFMRHLPVIIASTVLAILVFGFLARWSVQLYTVDGPSMNSTYKTGDLLFVNKLGKTITGALGKQFIPGRGEVVVFKKQRNVAFESVEANAPTFLVKRVVGLPGERVVVKNSEIIVINQQNPAGFNPDKDKPWSAQLHLSQLDDVDITLAADELFMVGDNRPESIDSRTFGPVKLHEIIGSVPWAIK